MYLGHRSDITDAVTMPVNKTHKTLNVQAVSDAGWRTGWTAGIRLGQGFHRDKGDTASFAIQWTKTEEPKWTCHPRGIYRVVTKSSDFSDMLTLGVVSGSSSYFHTLSCPFLCVDFDERC
jgi:hypothetical protein